MNTAKHEVRWDFAYWSQEERKPVVEQRSEVFHDDGSGVSLGNAMAFHSNMIDRMPEIEASTGGQICNLRLVRVTTEVIL